MATKLLDWIKGNKLKFMLLTALIVINYAIMPFLGYDNPLEEASEWVIKVWTGVDIELSPDIITEEFPLEAPSAS
jgi:hypothetical protein